MKRILPQRRTAPAATPGYLLRYALSLFLYYLGVLALVRFGRRLRGRAREVVLAYHGFRDGLPDIDMFLAPAIFRDQMRYLRREFDVISLSDFVGTREQNAAARRDTAVVTMDDGYRDNFTVALPICRELRMPMTVFVTTDCVELQRPTFVAALILVLDRTARSTLELHELGLGTVSLASRAARESVIRSVDTLAKSMDADAQQQLLRRVAQAAGVDLGAVLEQPLMLSWQQVKAMREDGMEIGAHSRSHAMLSRLSDDEVVEEIRGSLADVARALGEPVELFAYPYGGPTEVGERVIGLCASSGVRAAVTLVNDPPRRGPTHAIGRDMMTLDRTATPWGAFSRALFACEVHGLMDGLRRILGRSP